MEKPVTPSVRQLVIARTAQLMADDQTRRAALAYLAGQMRADICMDTAISADNAALTELCTKVAAELKQVKPDEPDADFAWMLDRSAFELMAKLQINGKLSRQLTDVLLLHAGEAGRSPSSLEQVMGKAASRKDLDNRLMAENMIFLEDSSAAARLRAFDYLAARGLAPAGYDPLGPPAERKKALDAALEKMAHSIGAKP
jgi:hypothetical protein